METRNSKLIARQDLQPARSVRELERKYPLGSIRKALRLAQSLEAELHSQAFLDTVVEAVLAKLNPEISSVILYELADNTAATGGWELTGYNMLESTSGGVVNIRAQYGGSGYYLTVKEFNVTALSKLVYSCGMGGVGTPEVVLVQNDTVVASGLIDMATATPTVPQTLDISNVKGSCRIGLKLQTYSNNILNAYMAYMALE